MVYCLCFFRMNLIPLFIFGIFYVSRGEQRVIQDCPNQQVLHVDPGTKLAFCCIPVNLTKDQEYVPCAINGTHDTTKRCAEGLFQEDETTTESEATCTATLQCITKENRKISKCDEKGENCKLACVCNYQDGFCGTAYYDCRPFPEHCPKEYVQEDCSCNKSFPYGSSTNSIKTTGSDVFRQRNSMVPTTGQPKINTKNDIVPTVGETNSTIKNNSTSGPGLEQEESGLPVSAVIGIVFGLIAILIAFIVVRYRVTLKNYLLCIIKRCRRRGQTEGYEIVDVVVIKPIPAIVPPPGRKPTAEVKHEFEDAQESQDMLAHNIPDFPIAGVDGAPVIPFEAVPLEVPPVVELSMEGYRTLSTIPSSSFDGEDTSVKQIASDQSNENTAIKQVEDVTDQTERVEVERNEIQSVAVIHPLGASDLPSVVPRFQSGSSGWSSFSDNIYSNTSGQSVAHPLGDSHTQMQDVRIEVNEEDTQVKEEK
ncbi:hypothetical protein ACJMK2_008443 [Sinanodonta woodiana]|uniref:Uncharacterized protein n=1 Tax=Sinanodonta woodiana TaxID=1069815 RepID=A0ABD3VLU8_SINWO